MKVLAENLTVKTKYADEQGCSVRAAEPNQNWCVGCSPDNCSGCGTFYEIKKQRDELLAALERFMDSHEECTDFDGFTAQIVSMADYHQAQEAITRAKGEQ